jgi:hypothetical protein
MANPNIIWLCSAGQSGGNGTFLSAQWDSGTTGLDGGKGRTAAYGMIANQLTRGFANVDTVYFGAAIQVDSGAIPNMLFRDGSTTQVNILMNVTDGVRVQRNGTALGSTGPIAAIAAGIVFHIQVKAVIHPSAGSVTVKINNATVLTLTGVNTRATSNSYVNSVQFQNQWWDDIVVSLDDWPGDLRCVAQLPTGDGATTDFTPSSGSASYAMVDESVQDSDTTYNASGTVGHKDLLTFPALSISGNPKAVLVLSHARGELGSAAIRGVLRTGGGSPTTSTGTTETLNTSYASRGRLCSPINPETGLDWTESEVNAAQSGYEVVSL